MERLRTTLFETHQGSFLSILTSDSRSFDRYKSISENTAVSAWFPEVWGCFRPAFSAAVVLLRRASSSDTSEYVSSICINNDECRIQFSILYLKFHRFSSHNRYYRGPRGRHTARSLRSKKATVVTTFNGWYVFCLLRIPRLIQINSGASTRSSKKGVLLSLFTMVCERKKSALPISDLSSAPDFLFPPGSWESLVVSNFRETFEEQHHVLGLLQIIAVVRVGMTTHSAAVLASSAQRTMSSKPWCRSLKQSSNWSFWKAQEC